VNIVIITSTIMLSLLETTWRQLGGCSRVYSSRAGGKTLKYGRRFEIVNFF